MSSILGTDVVGKVVEAGADLVDNLHTSAEERGKIKAGVISNVQNTRRTELQAQSGVVISEAKGESWIQRNWRPVTMLTFVAIIAWNYFFRDIIGMFVTGLPTLEIPPDLWALLKIGLGGYVVGRSAEKIAKETGSINMFSGGKIKKRQAKGLMKELRLARRRGDQETVDRILDILDED